MELRTVSKEKKTVAVLVVRSLIAFTAICFFYLALDRGSVSLISALAGMGPLVVFIYSTLVSFFRPQLIKEEISSQVLIQKAMAIILIIGGVILINQ